MTQLTRVHLVLVMGFGLLVAACEGGGEGPAAERRRMGADRPARHCRPAQRDAEGGEARPPWRSPETGGAIGQERGTDICGGGHLRWQAEPP